MKRRLALPSLLAAVVLVGALALATVGSAKPRPKPATVNVQLLALNDFHGNLEPPSGSSGRVGPSPGTNVLAGGAEYLATHIANLRALNPNTLVLSAGDMIGASPLLSSLFHDEPTIEAFNSIGLDFNAVGNHEFDEGVTELLRMQKGGCHPVDGCLDGDGFAGADFKFLAANVVYKDKEETHDHADKQDEDDDADEKDKKDKTIFPAWKAKKFDGVKVGIIGMTLEGTPLIVSPGGIADVEFKDEADTVNALIPKLKKKGIETIVVLVHEGATPAGTILPSTINDCSITGPVIDIVNRLDDEVDVVITGHTHQPYNCVIDNKIVTSSYSFGRLVTKIDLTIDRRSGEVTTMVADNKIVTRDVAKDAAQTALIAKYNVIAAPIANRVIGSITATITRTNNTAGESALGDVIADGQLAATAGPTVGSAVMAFMNPGGIRTDLNYTGSGAGEGDGNVTYGEMFAVQPFGNNLVTLTLTGTQIDTLLEQQFPGCRPAAAGTAILQVSLGFSYSWSASGPACAKVDPLTIKLNGIMIDPLGSYRVTVNSFLADGGDSFPVLPLGTNRLGGAVDTDAFEAYFGVNSPVPPGPQNRITQVS